ncbi:MAG: M28 family peptidase [Acidobacteria bacterium]|nr:M28 family peptidase [Acidobacteriota bacterium]
MKLPRLISKTLRLVLLLSLLIFAFLLYTVLKIRETPSVVRPMTPEIKKTRLYEHVEALSVKIGSRSVYEYARLEAAKDYIFTSLTAMGHKPELQTYTYEGKPFSNIIVTIPGKDQPEEVVLVGAHYDTYAGTPGADDNASALATLLELCRFLKDDQPGRTLKFVFFTLEEPPVFRSDFMGSAVYAESAHERGENIIAMLCLEMLGYYTDRKGEQGFPLPLMSLFYPTTPNFIAVVGNLASRRLVYDVAASLKKEGGVPVKTLATFNYFPGVDFSDHRSFWKQGYPAVMITDTAFFRNPNYHGETDTIETLDFKKMEALLRGLLLTIMDLGNRD